MEQNQNNKEQLVPLAFKQINTTTIAKDKDILEDVIDNHFSLNDDEDHPYDDVDFLLAREFSGVIREHNPTKLLTVDIVQTYKKCKKDFAFEEIMKPRRELTIPSEGRFQ